MIALTLIGFRHSLPVMISTPEYSTITTPDIPTTDQQPTGDSSPDSLSEVGYDPQHRLPIDFPKLIEQLNLHKHEWVITTLAGLLNLDVTQTIEQTTSIKQKYLNPTFDSPLPQSWQELFASTRWLVFVQWQPIDEQGEIDYTTVKGSDIIGIDERTDQLQIASGELLVPNHQIAIKIGRLPAGKELLTGKKPT